MLSGQQGFGGLVYKLYTFVLIDLARQPTTLEELSGFGFDLCRAVGGLVMDTYIIAMAWYTFSPPGVATVMSSEISTPPDPSPLNTRSNTHTHIARDL